jgi:hypothetical protein
MSGYDFKRLPLHRINVGDRIAYQACELQGSKAPRPYDMYDATVVRKEQYTLVLTTGTLLIQNLYRVINPCPSGSLIPVPCSRSKPKTFKGVPIE